MADQSIVILLGGESKRMGRDKAFVDWKGKTFLNHLYQELSAYNRNIFLSVNQNQYDHLHERYPCILDEEPKKGPLVAIFSAVKKLKGEILFFAVDMPESHYLHNQLSEQKGNTCFQLDGRIHPLPLKMNSNSLESLKAHLTEGNLSILSYIGFGRFNILSSENQNYFLNVNSLKSVQRTYRFNSRS